MVEPFEKFIARWKDPNHPTRRVQTAEFAEVEAKFGPLPKAYKETISTYGLPVATSGLLTAIVEHHPHVRDVAEFYTPNMIIVATESSRAVGLPSGLVAFACDEPGNDFCFKPEDQPDSDAVWFFDHDLIEVHEVAPSFREWIRQYSEL